MRSHPLVRRAPVVAVIALGALVCGSLVAPGLAGGALACRVCGGRGRREPLGGRRRRMSYQAVAEGEVDPVPGAHER